MRGDVEGLRDYSLIGNECRCRVAGPLLPHGGDGKQWWGQNASLLDAVENGEAARQRPIVLHLTFLTFMELTEDVERFGGTTKARQDFSVHHS